MEQAAVATVVADFAVQMMSLGSQKKVAGNEAVGKKYSVKYVNGSVKKLQYECSVNKMNNGQFFGYLKRRFQELPF